MPSSRCLLTITFRCEARLEATRYLPSCLCPRQDAVITPALCLSSSHCSADKGAQHAGRGAATTGTKPPLAAMHSHPEALRALQVTRGWLNWEVRSEAPTWCPSESRLRCAHAAANTGLHRPRRVTSKLFVLPVSKRLSCCAGRVCVHAPCGVCRKAGGDRQRTCSGLRGARKASAIARASMCAGAGQARYQGARRVPRRS